MPKSSYADFIEDWQTLLRSVEENAANLAAVEPHRLALQEHVELVMAQKVHQVASRANRQRSTQTLGDLMEKGKELAKQLRAAILATLGPKNEQLVGYGIAPQRKRGRNQKPVEPPSPTPAPAPPPEPAPQSTTK
jgi:hypothetical protein